MYHIWGTQEMHVKLYSRYLAGKDNFGDITVNGKILLQLNFIEIWCRDVNWLI
jgi:hypothetical protein